MALEIRVSSTTAGGAANATSLGGRPSSAAPSTTKHGFFDTVTSAQNDSGHTDYRCLFVYNPGPYAFTDVQVTVTNKGGGATATVALSSTAINTFASYNTAVIGNETTAPSITGSYAALASIGAMASGQVKAVWIKRVTTTGAAASANDTAIIVASGTEVVPI